LSTIGPIQRKEVSYWPLYVHKGQGTSSLFGDGTSDLVGKCAGGEKRVSSDLDVTEKIPISPRTGNEKDEMFPHLFPGNRCAYRSVPIVG
jgi:hypothetical protein